MKEKNAILINQPIETIEELTILGYRVLEAKNCIEGLRLIVRHCPDLVVCELRMPNFNGIAMVEIMELFHLNPPLIFTGKSAKDKKALHALKNHHSLLLHQEIRDHLPKIIERELKQPRNQRDRFTYSLRQREWADLANLDNRKKILMVEDSTWLKKSCIKAMDQMDSYALFSASDGLEGLIKALLIQPDLILTDLHMPQLDGLAMAEILYLLNQPFPLVFLTGDEHHGLAGKMERFGSILGVLLKTEMKDEYFFVQKLDELLNQSSLSKEERILEFDQTDGEFLNDTENRLFLEGKGLCTPGADFTPTSHHVEALKKNNRGMGAFFNTKTRVS